MFWMGIINMFKVIVSPGFLCICSSMGVSRPSVWALTKCEFYCDVAIYPPFVTRGVHGMRSTLCFSFLTPSKTKIPDEDYLCRFFESVVLIVLGLLSDNAKYFCIFPQTQHRTHYSNKQAKHNYCICKKKKTAITSISVFPHIIVWPAFLPFPTHTLQTQTLGSRQYSSAPKNAIILDNFNTCRTCVVLNATSSRTSSVTHLMTVHIMQRRHTTSKLLCSQHHSTPPKHYTI